MLRKTRIAVLCSGGGTNLQALLDAQAAGKLPHGDIVLVAADHKNAFALERARMGGVPARFVCPKGGEGDFERRLIGLLKEYGAELIILAGFLRILSPGFVKEYTDRIINVHPSLIPAFCGKGYYGMRVHAAALHYGVKVTGATVHLVNEIPDGGKILLQKAVAVQSEDTPESLQRRVMEQAEWVLLPEAAEMMAMEIWNANKAMAGRGESMTIEQAVSGSRYPGRGIVMGKTPDGTKALLGYFIMGRSINSRNRVFVADGAGIRTEAFDPAKMEDPSLIIYAPVRVFGNTTIVTNGDQTDTIYENVSCGGSFEQALQTRAFEPDAPNFTPRISGIATVEEGSLRFTLSILRRKADSGCERAFFPFAAPVPGEGRLIHTYAADGDPLPSFQGEPRFVALPDSLNVFFESLWAGLDEENRVALFARSVDLLTGETATLIRNKNQKGE